MPLDRLRLRSLVKQVALPLVTPFLAWLDRRVNHLMVLHDQSSDQAAISQHLPALLNAISTQNAAAREMRRGQVRVDADLERLQASIDALGVRLGEVADDLAQVWSAIERVDGRAGSSEARRDSGLAPAHTSATS